MEGQPITLTYVFFNSLIFCLLATQQDQLMMQHHVMIDMY